MSHQPQNEPRPRLKTIVGSVSALAVLAILLVQQSWVGSASLNDPRAAPRSIAPRGELSAGEKSTIAVFREASPSVVHITAIAVQRDLFTLNLYQIPEGTGTGFIWDNSGNIITNNHVIQNADAAQVTLADQSTWKAHRVGIATRAQPRRGGDGPRRTSSRTSPSSG